mmetsp:Transcript_59204/g.141364  ORF Transcript_59204/g.141364 Transcript_59204/m.141364 type:complete len:363 (+) Transcript_59204:355-1443(+)
MSLRICLRLETRTAVSQAHILRRELEVALHMGTTITGSSHLLLHSIHKDHPQVAHHLGHMVVHHMDPHHRTVIHRVRPQEEHLQGPHRRHMLHRMVIHHRKTCPLEGTHHRQLDILRVLHQAAILHSNHLRTVTGHHRVSSHHLLSSHPRSNRTHSNPTHLQLVDPRQQAIPVLPRRATHHQAATLKLQAMGPRLLARALRQGNPGINHHQDTHRQATVHLLQAMGHHPAIPHQLRVSNLHQAMVCLLVTLHLATLAHLLRELHQATILLQVWRPLRACHHQDRTCHLPLCSPPGLHRGGIMAESSPSTGRRGSASSNVRRRTQSFAEMFSFTRRRWGTSRLTWILSLLVRQTRTTCLRRGM